MEIERLAIPDIVLIKSRICRDGRGLLSETYRKSDFTDAGIRADFVQEVHTRSQDRGVVRGLHFQRPPKQQGKLVRVLTGAIQDIAVDIRTGSPTFGAHVSVILTARELHQLWVPGGFAHGYCTLEADTEVLYKVTDYYDPAAERGLAWDDPALAVEWQVAPDSAILSERDRGNPRLAELPEFFTYEALPVRT